MSKKVEKRDRSKNRPGSKIKTAKGIFISLDDAYLFLASAVGYALGQRTYIVGWTCDQVSKIAPQLKPFQRANLIKSIMGHGHRGGNYGDEQDKKRWLTLAPWLGGLD
jgi:hypothetical protein